MSLGLRYPPSTLGSSPERGTYGRLNISEAVWEYEELEVENASLDMQASARLVVIDQLLDLRTERTRDMDHYFRGVQMSVTGVRQKRRDRKQQPIKQIKTS